MAYNEKSLKKEHRKQWRTSKLVDKSCRNHGGCEYCRGCLLYTSPSPRDS